MKEESNIGQESKLISPSWRIEVTSIEKFLIDGGGMALSAEGVVVSSSCFF